MATDMARFLLDVMLAPQRVPGSGRIRERDGSWFAVLARRWSPTGFVETVGGDKEQLQRQGEYLRTTRLTRPTPNRYAWQIVESIQVGPVPLPAIVLSFTNTLRALEISACRNPTQLLRPTIDAAEGLLRMDATCSEHGPGGAVGALLSLQVGRNLSGAARLRAPAVAEYFEDHLASLRISLEVRDDAGREWFRIAPNDAGTVLRFRVRDGHLAPIDAGRESNQPAPERFHLHLTGDTRKAVFRLGAADVQGELTFGSTNTRLEMTARLTGAPHWRLPFFVRPILASNLDRIFDGEGIRISTALSSVGNSTLAQRELQFHLEPNWLVSWIGGAATSARGDISPAVGAFLGRILNQLANDLAAITQKAE